MSEYQHIINIQVKFQTKEQADAFWLNLHGRNDVLGEMENGIERATGERPHVDIEPGPENYLANITEEPAYWS